MKKSYGQHLLVEQNYLKQIVDSIKLKPSDVVIEIGAGSGILTMQLASKVKKIYAVEPEKSILKKLKENLKKNKLMNVEVIESNFLKLDLNRLVGSSFAIIGNIPYNITSKILLKLFGEIDKPAAHLHLIEKVYLMVQSEVADRIVAQPNTKAYSPLTLLVQYFTAPEILVKVPASAFYPAPKVDSAFLFFSPKKNLPKIQDLTKLKNIIRIGFQQRRKKLINSLNKLCDDKGRIVKVFDKLGLDHNFRAENLSIEQYIEIAQGL